MSILYELVGRVVVWFVRVRYGRQIRIALAALGAAALLGAGYVVATREPPEG